MTIYVAAYDVESPTCLEGVRTIVQRHEQHEMPATFFMVAATLEWNREEYTALLGDHPLFEIGCHTYTHMPIVDTPEFGKAGPVERFPHELVDSKCVLEDAFGCEVIGFRTPVGTLTGIGEVLEALKLLDQAGYRYVSSLAWGPCWSLPAPPRRPFTYAEQGYPNLWELPPCGWHENLLKGNNRCGPRRLLLFPTGLDVPIPRDYIQTSEEEFEVNNRPFIDLAVAQEMPLVSLIWHPWSLNMFDPKMRMLDMTFRYVQERDLLVATFAEVAQQLEQSTSEEVG